MKRDFNEWLSKFKTSISDYTYYVDFEKKIDMVTWNWINFDDSTFYNKQI